MLVALLVAAALAFHDAGGTPPKATVDDNGKDGTSVAHAIVVTASDELSGITAEHEYIVSKSCGNGGSWKWTSQATLSSNHREYDQIDVICSDGSSKRSFFFDITSFFGQL